MKRFWVFSLSIILLTITITSIMGIDSHQPESMPTLSNNDSTDTKIENKKNALVFRENKLRASNYKNSMGFEEPQEDFNFEMDINLEETGHDLEFLSDREEYLESLKDQLEALFSSNKNKERTQLLADLLESNELTDGEKLSFVYDEMFGMHFHLNEKNQSSKGIEVSLIWLLDSFGSSSRAVENAILIGLAYHPNRIALEMAQKRVNLEYEIINSAKLRLKDTNLSEELDEIISEIN